MAMEQELILSIDMSFITLRQVIHSQLQQILVGILSMTDQEWPFGLTNSGY